MSNADFRSWMQELREIAEYQGVPELVGPDEDHLRNFKAGVTPADVWRGLVDRLDEPTPRQMQRNA